MCVWAMQQGDEFYDQQLNESRYGGGVWNMIASVLKVGAAAPPHVADAGAGEGDPAQSRGTVRQQENVAQVLDIVDQVQRRMKGTMSSMREQLKGIVKTLTLDQQVKFLLWMQGVLKEPRTKDSVFMVLKRHIEEKR